MVCVKEARVWMATAGDADVPGDVIKLLVEGGVRLMTQLFNNVYELRE